MPKKPTKDNKKQQIMGRTMLYYVLRGERNLGLNKAKLAAKATGTDAIIWIDPAKAGERKKAWERSFGN